MDNPIQAVILDQETAVIDGRLLVEKEEIGDALRPALQSDPHIIIWMIAPNGLNGRYF